ncbi:MAG: XisI protein [Oscillatoriales cyanobacterium]|nr:MAG: XisI protein [Oscillatoriales cyanobacterium]
MDTRLRYQKIIKTILQEHANFRNTIPDGYHSQLLFDDERGGYLVLDIGWNENKYLHATPIHDDTEEGVATDLLAAGVPNEDIVLGFRHPQVRPYTEFGTGLSCKDEEIVAESAVMRSA